MVERHVALLPSSYDGGVVGDETEPVGSNEGESGTNAGESAAQASLPEPAAGATASREPSAREEGSTQEEERPLRQKRRRAETPLRSATSAIHPSERVIAASRGKAPEVEAISSDRTPSQLDASADPLEAVPISALPPAPRKVHRSTILSQFSASASDPSPASAQTTPGRRRTIRVSLHLSTEELMPEADRPTTPEHLITMKGPLAEMWADAQARVAIIPLSSLANSHMQQATGRWVEEIVVSNRLAMVDEELRRLKAAYGPPGSQGPSYSELQKELKKAQNLLAVEQKKTADQAHTLVELERVFALNSSAMPSDILRKRGKEIMTDQEVPPTSASAGASSQQTGGHEILEEESRPTSEPSAATTSSERTSSPAAQRLLLLERKRRRMTPLVQSSPQRPPMSRVSGKAKTPAWDSTPVSSEVTASSPVPTSV
ncbi:nucleolar and coiled-body phosphoprotein 1-like [Zingiber officinale]|uniref:nucleolar and coiled-body phosphoprotein 1-like n=1 Tax=Zingiber officinale TaxID=94328 RepID=UPI001C4D7DF9|nr:nucleolar and coiled-body phosphoprotein 1-like [Zingiber officinale]